MSRRLPACVLAVGLLTAAFGLLSAGVAENTLRPLGFGLASTAEGLVYCLLASTIARRSRIAGFLAAALLLLDTALLVIMQNGLSTMPGLGLSAVRLILALLLIRAASNIDRIISIPIAVMPKPAPGIRRESLLGTAMQPPAGPEPAATVSSLVAALERAQTSAMLKEMPHPSTDREGASQQQKLEADAVQAPIIDTPAAAASKETPATATVFANVADAHGMIRCPRCELRQIEAAECFGCGIDFARYWAARQRVLALEAKLGRSRPIAD